MTIRETSRERLRLAREEGERRDVPLTIHLTALEAAQLLALCRTAEHNTDEPCTPDEMIGVLLSWGTQGEVAGQTRAHR